MRPSRPENLPNLPNSSGIIVLNGRLKSLPQVPKNLFGPLAAIETLTFVCRKREVGCFGGTKSKEAGGRGGWTKQDLNMGDRCSFPVSY